MNVNIYLANLIMLVPIMSLCLAAPFFTTASCFCSAYHLCTCMYVGVLPYLTLRGMHNGPLFITEHIEGLTRQIFSASLDLLLAELQLKPNHYNSHSFRIGATTSAAQANIPEPYIKMLGHW